MYGCELILDLYGCDASKFTRESIEQWLEGLCDLIDMQREDLHFWDYHGRPEEYERAPAHLAGTSAVQFITTSAVVIHALDQLGECYVNIFSCKSFNSELAVKFTKNWFRAVICDYKPFIRGDRSKCK